MAVCSKAFFKTAHFLARRGMRVEHPMSLREQTLSRALKALAEQQGAVSPCASAFVLQALQPGLSMYRLLRCLADQYSPLQDLQEASACVEGKEDQER